MSVITSEILEKIAIKNGISTDKLIKESLISFLKEKKRVLQKNFRIFLISLILFLIPSFANCSVERVILISIDSLNNNYIFNEWQNPNFILTPNIGELIRNGAYFTNAKGVLPSLTQINHITMVCGCYAEKIGFAGNEVYIKEKKGPMPFGFPYQEPKFIKCDTLFKAMERENPEYETAVVAGKNFVGCPIWADYTIGPLCVSESVKKEFKEIREFPELNGWDSPDNWVMDNALLLLKRKDIDMMFLHLGFLDPAQHYFGNLSSEAWAALSFADYQVGRLIKYLKESNKLKDTLIILTADHGQSNFWIHIDLKEILENEGINIKFIHSLGPAAHIFLKNKNDLNKTVKFLKSLKYFDGIWYGDRLDDIHIKTPYTGDIFVSLLPPYNIVAGNLGPFRIISPDFGLHSGLLQQYVPLIFFGPGIKRGKRLDDVSSASLVDIAPTICELTGLPKPEDSQGKILPVMDRYKSSPEIECYTEIEKDKFESKITTLLYLISLILLFAFIMKKNEDKKSIGSGFMVIVSFTFASTSLLLIQFLRLYAVIPGIQPDAFLLSKIVILYGTPIYGHLIFQFIRWFSFWIIFGLILWLLCRLFIGKSKINILRVFPVALIPWIITHQVLTAVHFTTKIDYKIFSSLYLTFWYIGFALTCIFVINLIRNIYQTTIAKSTICSLIFAAIFLLILFIIGNNEALRFSIYNLSYYLAHSYY